MLSACAAHWRTTCPMRPPGMPTCSPSSTSTGRPRPSAGRRPLLRLRERRLPAGHGGLELAGDGVGPERGAPHHVARASHPAIVAAMDTEAALRLPEQSAGAFVVGATMANFTALAAARHAVLRRAGWNVDRDGLMGGPSDSRSSWAPRSTRPFVACSDCSVWDGAHHRRSSARGRPGTNQGDGLATADRAGDRMHPGRQRERRRVRPGAGVVRLGRGAWRLGARRWRVRTLGAGRATSPARWTASNARTRGPRTPTSG